jgi:hypothetical protein
MIDTQLLLTAAYRIKWAYDQEHFNVLSTEWAEGVFLHKGQRIQYVAIPGSNDLIDWFWNITLASWDGVKLASYYSANRIKKRFRKLQGMPLLVCGHSKEGPTAVYLGKLLEADYCISFNPAPGFRKREKVKNAVLVIDPDDIVFHLGKLNFKHPDCTVYTLPKNHKSYSLQDHCIQNAIDYLELLLGQSGDIMDIQKSN